MQSKSVDYCRFKRWLSVKQIWITYWENKVNLLTSETKIDQSFPDTQVKVDGFDNPIESFREYLPIKVRQVDKGYESCCVEVILEKKWLKTAHTVALKARSSHIWKYLGGW